ncbi:MAG: cell division protein FtsQ/DivIB [Thermoleophilia bacterium]
MPEHFRRRRRIAAVALGLIFAVFAGGLGGRTLLYDAGLADVEGVEITGVRTVPEQAVREAAAVTTGVPLAGVDLDAIERRVEGLPAVADAVAGRDWPHTVTIEVTERVPAGIADTPQGPYLVDVSGVAYVPVPDQVNVPKLAVGVLDPGAPATPATRAALDVVAALPADLRGQVTAVEVGPVPALPVVLRLTENREVRFGSPDRATDKAAVLGPLLSQRAAVYDVVSPELPTIRR